MNLTPEQREQVRLCILRYCLRPTRTGMILQNLRAEGYTLPRDVVELEIEYLSDPKKGLLTVNHKLVSPENKIWQTTAEGRDTLAGSKEEES